MGPPSAVHSLVLIAVVSPAAEGIGDAPLRLPLELALLALPLCVGRTRRHLRSYAYISSTHRS